MMMTKESKHVALKE